MLFSIIKSYKYYKLSIFSWAMLNIGSLGFGAIHFELVKYLKLKY